MNAGKYSCGMECYYSVLFNKIVESVQCVEPLLELLNITSAGHTCLSEAERW